MIRVTGLMTDRSLMANHDRATENLYEAERQVSSGKRADTPGDAPEAVSEVLRINRSLAVTGQIIQNAREGASRISLMESILTQIDNVMIRAKGLAIRQANGTMDAEDRRIAAEEAARLLEQTVALANTRGGEQYLFGGTNISIPPFLLGDPQKEPFVVSYKGNHRSSTIQQGFTPSFRQAGLMKTTVSGDRILGDSKKNPDANLAFPALRRFVLGLRSNDEVAIHNAIGELDLAIRSISERAAVLGTYERSLRSTIARLEKYRTDLKVLRSETEDVDIPKAASRMALSQNLLEVSAKASRNILQNVQNVLFH
ncbi:MAG: flagellin [Nitrospiraceae bacterium]|jgi:flagellar hook-associated protein 3 FlgL|nr:flagellin [Nitrospiraceae bacterium]